jgi:hypothetical protein
MTRRRGNSGVTFWAVGLVVFIVTLLGLPARATYGAQTSADEPQYLLSALSLFEDGDLDIADEREDEAYRAFHESSLPVQTVLQPDGSRLSPHNPLLPVYLAIPVGVAGWAGAKVALAALAGALSALLAWVAVKRFALAGLWAAVVVVVFAASPPFALYATQIYPEIPAALAVTIAIASLTGPPGRWATATAGLAVVALPWLAVKYVPVTAVLAIGALFWLRERRPLQIGLVVGLAASGIVYLWFNQEMYGGWTPYAAGDFFATGELRALGPKPNYPGRSTRLVGLMVDREFGIAAWQPAYLLLFPALAAGIRQRLAHRRLLLAILASGWLVATFVAQTMHGWWWPGRQLVVALPVAVLLIGVWTGPVRARRFTLVGLGAAGVLSFLIVTAEAAAGRVALIVDFFDTINPIYRLWSLVLPAYRLEPAGVWILHGVWLVVVAVLLRLGWRSRRSVPQQADEVALETH